MRGRDKESQLYFLKNKAHSAVIRSNMVVFVVKVLFNPCGSFCNVSQRKGRKEKEEQVDGRKLRRIGGKAGTINRIIN